MNDSITEQATEPDTVAQGKLTDRLPILREFVIVIIGALIALAADDYQEASERAERDRQVLVMIQTELQANLDFIIEAGDYHSSIQPKWLESADLFAKEGNFTLPEGWQDTRQIESYNAAYQLAVINGTLSRITPESGIKLTRVYDEIANFDEERSQIALATIQSSFRDGTRYYTLRNVGLQLEIRYIDTMTPLLEEAITVVEQQLLE